METSIRSAIQLSDVVAKEVRVMLIRRDMKQTELADRMGKSEMWLSRRLRGAQPIDLNDLQLIADALGVEVTDLLPRPSEGRTVVVAGSTRGLPTVTKLDPPSRPPTNGRQDRTSPPSSTRRPVRIERTQAQE